MKGLVGITCLFWLLAGPAACAHLRPYSLKPGKTYVYDVESSVLAGVPELQNQYSGFSIIYKMDLYVVSEKSSVMQLRQVRTGKINDEVPVSYEEDIAFHHTSAPEYERELVKPIEITYESGLITDFKAEESDPIWSINIKRAIMTNFQLDLTKTGESLPQRGNSNPIDVEAEIYRMYEDGIGGECETRYNIFSVPSLDDPDMEEDVLNITKTKNFRNCKSRPQWQWDNYDLQGCPDVCRQSEPKQYSDLYPVSEQTTSHFENGCPYGFQPDFHPVKSYSLTKYNVSGASHNPVIEDIYNEGKTVYNFNGDELMIVVQQNFTLVKNVTSLAGKPTLRKPKAYDSLAYELPLEEDHEHLHQFAFYSIFGPIQSDELMEIFLNKLDDAVEDIIPDDPKSSEYLGTKIIELQNALTVMRYEHLEEIYKRLENSKTQRLPHKGELMRKIFLDLLANPSGNASAVYAIDLIKAQEISVLESVELLDGLAKNLPNPTQEVIQDLLDLLDQPWVSSKRILLNSVALTIGKFVEEACVSPSIVPAYINSTQSRSDAEDLNGPSKRQDVRQLTDEICSEKQLKSHIKAIALRLSKTKSIDRMALYIEVLAHMGTPLVLPILEPFISGEAKQLEKLLGEDAEFLRGVAIYALHHISDVYPEETLPLVKSIYFDESEGYELRSAAFTVIMESKPDLILLERIATELYDEDSNQLASFVYSHLQLAANSSLPCKRQLAQKAQLVLSHAPELDLGIQYSNVYGYDFYDDDRDYGVEGKIGYVASNVSNFPRSAYVALSHIAGPFQDDLLEMGFSAKGLDELLEKLIKPGGIIAQLFPKLASSTQKSHVDNVLQALKGKLAFNYRKPDAPRASLYFSLLGRTSYLTLDEKDAVQALEKVVQWFMEMDLANGLSAHYVKVWMPSSFFKVVPSAIGFPIVVNHRNPVVLSLIIENARVKSGDGAYALSTVIRPSLHVSTIVMAYAISPAEDRLYGTAFERVYEVSAPAVVYVGIDSRSDQYVVSIKPKLPHRLFFHRSRPTTFQAKAILIDVSKDEWLDQVNEITELSEPLKYERRYESKALGLALRSQAETENIWANIPFWLNGASYEDDIVAGLLEALKNPGLTPREYHLYLEPHTRQPASEFVITLDYDRKLSLSLAPIQDPSLKADDDQSSEEPQSKFLQGNFPGSFDCPICQKRKSPEKIVLEKIKLANATWASELGKVTDPVPAAVSHIWKLNTIIKGSKPRYLSWELAYAHTLDHRAIWAEIRGVKSSDGKPWELCASYEALYPSIPNQFYLKMNELDAEKVTLQASLGYGADCLRENRAHLVGVMEKSEEQKQISSDEKNLPWFYSACEVHSAEGETQSDACQQAISHASTLNRIELNISGHLSPAMVNVTSRIDLALKSYYYPNLEVNPLAYNQENALRIVIESSDEVEDIPLTNVYLYKPTENVFFHKLYTPSYSPPSTLDSIREIYGDMLMNDDYESSCNMMEDYVQTLDNVTYMIPDNKCEYLLAKDCSSDMSFAVLARQIDEVAKTKALRVSVGCHHLEIVKKGRKGEFAVFVDDVEKRLTRKNPQVLDFNHFEEMFVYVLNTQLGSHDSTVLVIETDELTIHFDGKNVEVSLPKEYMGDTCGLCGDFNGEQFRDFTGPNRCAFVNATDFANSYAMSAKECPIAPKPVGPAFCPNQKSQWKQNNKDSQSEEQSEEQGHRRPASTRRPRVESSEEETHHRVLKSGSPAQPKAKPVPSYKDKKHEASNESDEEDESEEQPSKSPKPSGPSRCIKQVTEYAEKDSETCFTIHPVHRCAESCKPSGRSTTVSLPVQCFDSRKDFVADLKAQARSTVIKQMANKKSDRKQLFQIPEKCV